MNFENIINELENKVYPQNIVSLNGSLPICITSIHSMEQIKEDGSVKKGEPYTKAIAEYLNKYTDVNALIKTRDNGHDPNHEEAENFKKVLISKVKEKDIKLVLDIHGASEDRPFDIELGTMNNLSADFSTINELKEAFEEQDINNIILNNPFKGGLLTQTLFFSTDVEVIQIEINKKIRMDMNKLKQTCDALIKFINEYNGTKKVNN